MAPLGIEPMTCRFVA